MAIDFIPIELYTPIYFHILLLVVLPTFIHMGTQPLGSSQNFKFSNVAGPLLLLFVLLYMGLRPIHGVFVDMTTYAADFERFKMGRGMTNSPDPVFQNFIMFSSRIMSAQTFFFVCAALYILPLYIVSKKWFNDYWFYGFLFLVGSFSFWAYGVNGIRNGIAGSLFLLGVSRDKRIFQALWISLAVGVHFSMLLPTVGFILANVYNQPKKFIWLWLLAIPLSIFSGGLWENLFAGLGFEDQRLNYLTTEASSSEFSRIGFRWDFLLYSATAVFAGYYYIVIKKFEDKFYNLLFNTYLFANTFWILVIRANFSNRFAYLSWFMMAIVVIYPLLKTRILNSQHIKIGLILLGYFGFTYLMGVILN